LDSEFLNLNILGSVDPFRNLIADNPYFGSIITPTRRKIGIKRDSPTIHCKKRRKTFGNSLKNLGNLIMLKKMSRKWKQIETGRL